MRKDQRDRLVQRLLSQNSPHSEVVSQNMFPSHQFESTLSANPFVATRVTTKTMRYCGERIECGEFWTVKGPPIDSFGLCAFLWHFSRIFIKYFHPKIFDQRENHFLDVKSDHLTANVVSTVLCFLHLRSARRFYFAIAM
jgi:hypothetical protein